MPDYKVDIICMFAETKGNKRVMIQLVLLENEQKGQLEIFKEGFPVNSTVRKRALKKAFPSSFRLSQFPSLLDRLIMAEAIICATNQFLLTTRKPFLLTVNEKIKKCCALTLSKSKRGPKGCNKIQDVS